MQDKLNILRKEIPNKALFTTFSKIVETMIFMSGNKNMLNISRWSELKYKKVERFFDKILCWMSINIGILSYFLIDRELILASDETISTKSGKKTHGIGLFWSSILKKSVKSISISSLSIIDVLNNKSYQLYSKQLIFTKEEKLEIERKKEKIKKSKGKKVGRPTGAKNAKQEKKETGTFRLLREILELYVKKTKFKIKHFVGDGKYANNVCSNICNGLGISLVSKLQHNSALYYEFDKLEGKKRRGRPSKYGKKIEIDKLEDKYLKSIKEIDGEIEKIFQIKCLNKSFDNPLNVIFILNTNIETKKTTYAILFSTDLELSYQKIRTYYSSRFQIEFNFRDEKQFWGLEDFMNTKEIRIHNFINLSAFMVNFSQIIIHEHRKNNKLFSVNDLIALTRSKFYTSRILKLIKKEYNNFYFDENTINPYPIVSINL